MDYTQSDSFDTDANTGNRFHEDSKAVPTIFSGKDANSLIWSLMELLKAAGIEGKQFNRADPSTYTLVRDSIDEMIRKQVEVMGPFPRFTPYLWPGRADAMPHGDQQSSGQQLLDLMYPTMRAEVIATQFYCTEQEWQADPYKRVTHWSLGRDGWMRPPDKNGVQPGNVGAFYGAGSNPAGAKTGAAVIDTMRNVEGSLTGITIGTFGPSGTGALSPAQVYNWRLPSNIAESVGSQGLGVKFNAANGLPAGTTTDPITGEFRPRTWYGIWMIRMYGRVMNPGALDAAGLNARIEMMDVRLAKLEGAFSGGRTETSWWKWTNGRLRQGGSFTVPASGAGRVAFPISFQKHIDSLLMGPDAMATSGIEITGAHSPDLGGFTATLVNTAGALIGGRIWWEASGD